eukprot:GILI01009623.1.p1 GENE.GILI01009623.1~~GILI01009623.1.p1  ORF type:complete len:345 (+),score=87.94 GILI01009623.1:145-1179(+)
MSSSTNPAIDVDGADARGKSTRICRHFARGRCTWGDQCRFSHDPNQIQAEQQRTQQLTAVNIGAAPTIGSASAAAPVANSAWIGQQQSQLQQQRHSILMAGISGQFVLRLEGSNGVIHLPNLNAADVPVTIHSEASLRNELLMLERDEKIKDGGLHYLVGEPSVFWSMMRMLHTEGTTGSAHWDMLVQRALASKVGCMFYHSAAGCLAPKCVFEHVPKQHSQLMALATSNAMLNQVPALFGAVPMQQQQHQHQQQLVAMSGMKDPAFVSIAGAHHDGSNNHIISSSVGSQQASQGNWACVSGQAVLGSSSHLGSLLVTRQHEGEMPMGVWAQHPGDVNPSTGWQ